MISLPTFKSVRDENRRSFYSGECNIILKDSDILESIKRDKTAIKYRVDKFTQYFPGIAVRNNRGNDADPLGNGSVATYALENGESVYIAAVLTYESHPHFEDYDYISEEYGSLYPDHYGSIDPDREILVPDETTVFRWINSIQDVTAKLTKTLGKTVAYEIANKRLQYAMTRCIDDRDNKPEVDSYCIVYASFTDKSDAESWAHLSSLDDANVWNICYSTMVDKSCLGDYQVDKYENPNLTSIMIEYGLLDELVYLYNVGRIVSR